jgi:hypothetical protein
VVVLSTGASFAIHSSSTLAASSTVAAFRPPDRVITIHSIAGAKIGDTLQRMIRIWGAPSDFGGSGFATFRGRKVRSDSYNWGVGGPYDGNGYIEFYNGRAGGIELSLKGSMVHTPKGDRWGTPYLVVRHHWPNLRLLPNTINGQRILWERARPDGYFLIFHTIPSLRGSDKTPRLDEVSLAAVLPSGCSYTKDCGESG